MFLKRKMCGVAKDYVADAFEALKLLVTKGDKKELSEKMSEDIGRLYGDLLKIINARPKPEEDTNDHCECGCY